MKTIERLQGTRPAEETQKRLNSVRNIALLANVHFRRYLSITEKHDAIDHKSDFKVKMAKSANRNSSDLGEECPLIYQALQFLCKDRTVGSLNSLLSPFQSIGLINFDVLTLKPI